MIRFLKAYNSGIASNWLGLPQPASIFTRPIALAIGARSGSLASDGAPSHSHPFFRYYRPLVALFLALTLSSCANLPTVQLKGQTYQVELARNDADRAKGLMFRNQMPDDHGMLFIFPNEDRRSFWMKNTRIPLDILYFDADARFVSGQYNVPTCAGGDRCPSYPSEGPAKYVLELNAGVGKRLDLKAGDVLSLPAGLASED